MPGSLKRRPAMAKKKKRMIVRVQWSRVQSKWLVTYGNSTKDFRVKTAAVDHGKDIAKDREPSQLMVHKKDGKFQTEYTYGDDPVRSKG
jgi:hypothetical protein